jgi:hypothetical protein
MQKIENIESIFDNGEIWPHSSLVFPEIAKRGASKIICKRWIFNGNTHQLAMAGPNSYEVVEVLPDKTGLVIMKHFDVPQALVLNGDGSVRFTLKPEFNKRGFDGGRIAVIQKLDEAEAMKIGVKPVPRTEQAIFHCKTDRNDVLELFGDDGYGDCLYRYDSDTGILLSFETHPRRS